MSSGVSPAVTIGTTSVSLATVSGLKKSHVESTARS